ncbi:hypothetical protein OUZ56_023473 [Daphnia magna]|uniref:Uncharacterized protein n=1 Tax=Daphnia magna TaxID=35525 RepID=A0ABR0AZ62_9CRUS|nr:hypothetical protein OUZ56_023473 [Daphnia magna]
MKFTRSRNGSTLLTEEIELHSFCSRDGVAAEIPINQPQTPSLELNTRSSTDSAAVTTPDIYCRGYLRPHGLVVTSGASVSAIDRNSTRDVRHVLSADISPGSCCLR